MRNSSLILDVGMHKGEDTEFYLSRGYRVVGVEANPSLVQQLRSKFTKEISESRVCIVNKAISSVPGKSYLITYSEKSDWGTIDERFDRRNIDTEIGERQTIEIDSVSLADVLKEYGMPYYMKVDIEGMDMLCVKALQEFQDRPAYVSIESAVTFCASNYESAFDEIAYLWTLGYRQFKYVDQAALPSLTGKILDREGTPVRYEFRPDSSGPFGEETPGRWLNIETALHTMKRLIRYQNTMGRGGRYSSSLLSKAARKARSLAKGLPYGSWYDLHARLGGIDE